MRANEIPLSGQHFNLELSGDVTGLQFFYESVFELDAAGDEFIPIRRRNSFNRFGVLGLLVCFWIFWAMCRHFDLVI